MVPSRKRRRKRTSSDVTKNALLRGNREILPLPGISVFGRGFSHDFFEQPREIVGILEAETVADLLDALAGQVQMLAGPLDFESQIVIDGGVARRFLEPEGEVRYGQIGVGRQLLQAHMPLQMLGHEPKRLLHVMLVILVQPPLRVKPGEADHGRQVAGELRDMDDMVQRIPFLQQLVTFLKQLHDTP